MRRWQALLLVVSAPLILVGVVWQAGRVATGAAEARALEAEQRAWVDANRKLLGGISVLESRERAADLAARLGLTRAAADKRVFIDTGAGTPGRGAPAPKAGGGQDG